MKSRRFNRWRAWGSARCSALSPRRRMRLRLRGPTRRAAPVRQARHGRDRGDRPRRQPTSLLYRGNSQKRAAGPRRCSDDGGPGPTEPLPGKKPNIVVIMGDDLGPGSISALLPPGHDGRQDAFNLDRLASQGMLFTDYYAPRRAARPGDANSIPGQLPIRTGACGQSRPGGLHDPASPRRRPTTATVLKSMGYATGQFGKNHLGDRNQFLPTVHGFDEFFGYLYHLDAMEDPAHPNYPQDLHGRSRPAQHGAFLGDRSRRPDRAAAAGQDRQAADRGRRHALSSKRMETRERRGPRTLCSSSLTRPRATASHSSSG